MKNSYNFLTSIFVALILLVQTSCSWNSLRAPAAIKKTSDSISYEDVFSFQKGETIVQNDFKQEFIQSLGFNYPPEIKFLFKASKDLPDNIAFKLEFDIVDDQYTVRILHSNNAFKDPHAAYELGSFLAKMLVAGTSPLQKYQSYYEMYYNAVEGDPIALDNFLKIKSTPLAYYTQYYANLLPDDLQPRLEAAREMRSQMAPQIKELMRKRKVLSEKRKALMDKLDKAPDNKQLKTLVAKNDRKGVSDLLQKYLPWEEMAPFEKKYWETQLEVIKNPVPLDRRILIYRGLEDDFIHIAYEGSNEIDKEEALKEGKVFVMSTVLVKNQGSWNRRLRSLESMNDKYIATINESNEYSQSARLSTMFYKHSADPKGSPFLSFTPKMDVASSFGHTKMMYGLIDPRLLQFNYASSFQNEVEYLLPLVTFPDEMVGFWNSRYHSGIERKTFFEQRLKLKISDEYGKAKADDIIKQIKKNTADFFNPVYKTDTPKIKGMSGGTMASFYKKFAPSAELKPALTPDGNLTCKDLIKIFWAIP